MKWLGFVLAVASGILILFHLEDEQGARPIRPVDNFRFFAGVLGFFIGSLWFVGCVMKEVKASKRATSRGFEVKINTGETPVPLKERDDDHG